MDPTTTMTLVSGWILTLAKTAVSSAVSKIAEKTMTKMGIFDATCEKCNTKQTGLTLVAEKPITLTCAKCGHKGTIYIENVSKLVIYQIVQANIYVGNANILVNNRNHELDRPENRGLLPAGASQGDEIIDGSFSPVQGDVVPRIEFENLVKENTALKARISVLEKEAEEKNSARPSGGTYRTEYGEINKAIVEKKVREAISHVKDHYYDLGFWGGAIKEFLVTEVNAAPNSTSSADSVFVRVVIVPESHELMGKISTSVNTKLLEYLKAIGLSLSKASITFDDALPKKDSLSFY